MFLRVFCEDPLHLKISLPRAKKNDGKKNRAFVFCFPDRSAFCGPGVGARRVAKSGRLAERGRFSIWFGFVLSGDFLFFAEKSKGKALRGFGKVRNKIIRVTLSRISLAFPE